jgi:nitric oxide dioxygenase
LLAFNSAIALSEIFYIRNLNVSLSNKQITLIQDSFKLVVPIKDQAADIFYTKLFEYDPELKPLFKTSMLTQGQKLMATLGAAVNGLNSLPTLVPILENLAIRHIDYGVKPEHYDTVGKALIDTLQAGLGDQFTPSVKEAWLDLYTLVATVMQNAAYPEQFATN